MKAEIVQATSMNRVRLAEVIPLETPFTLEIFPTNACNFKCIYCAHSNANVNFSFCNMDFELYKKCIDDVSKFPQRLKLLLFAGLGEPLLHPKIVDMVKYAKEKNVAETVRIITNASLLTPAMSDGLIAAGLDSLKISIQGLTDTKYKEMCGTSIPLARIMDNIRYFYEHKDVTQVNVKIVADAFDSPKDEQLFYHMFGDICDIMNIENIADYQSDAIMKKKGEFVSQTATLSAANRICQMPFYFYSVLENGEIIPCCQLMNSGYESISMGNVRETNLCDVWMSDEFHKFRKMHLLERKNHYRACVNCTTYQSTCREEDCLDEYKEELLSKYQHVKLTEEV